MSDIDIDLVTRLHATSKKFPDEFGMLCLDAKAEIERLKAELAETIAAFPLGAVKAERARCATIAETTEREGFGGGAYNEAGRDIAAAIRGQTDD